MKNYKLINADCIEAMKQMQENSIDSIVTDPPYELGFMGKSWDASGIAYNVEMWAEALRILKPGGHLLAFGGSRTYHRLAVAIEDAGFQIRDSIAWIYGSGFPKSMDVSKAIDKAAGAERKTVPATGGLHKNANLNDDGWHKIGDDTATMWSCTPATPAAKQWQGWGTALKPAIEPIVVARKPIEGTVAANVLKWGTGGLNIDGSRIGTQGGTARDGKANQPNDSGWANMKGHGIAELNTGRWPANIILDPYTAELLDEQSGQVKGGTWNNTDGARHFDNNGKPTNFQTKKKDNSTGGASRFFYVAKASKRDRNEGLEDLPEVQTTGGGGLTAEYREDGSLETASAGGKYGSIKAKQTNFHPTVKPTQLMRYLVRLVTPPDGTVLDPFMGSGSTGKAAMLESFNFIGIEQSAEYITICEKRIEHAKQHKEKEPEQQNLF